MAVKSIRIRHRKFVVNNRERSPRVTIRPYRHADAATTLRIFQDAITRIASADYTSEQITAWVRPGERRLPEWDQSMWDRNSYVALLGEQIAGFSDVSVHGHIEMLFVSPHFAGQGVARELLNFLEFEARSHSAQQLSADVSITARPLFEACGFQVEAKYQPVVHGIAMTNFRMTKQLPRRK